MVDEKDILVDFIKESYKVGKSRSEIKDVLLKSDWNEKVIDNALSKFSDVDYPIAVPKPSIDISKRTYFLNSVFFASLGTVIFCFVLILYSIIDLYLPDLSGSYVLSLRKSVRMLMSILICCVPILWKFGNIIKKDMSKSQEQISSIRLRFVYYTMEIVLGLVLICAARTIYVFLSGDITLCFIIKIIIFFATCAGVYFYFRPEIKKAEATNE